MQEILAAQRAAFMAELPVTAAVRRDRLKRAAAMIADNADAWLLTYLVDEFTASGKFWVSRQKAPCAGNVTPPVQVIPSFGKWFDV